MGNDAESLERNNVLRFDSEIPWDCSRTYRVTKRIDQSDSY